MAHTSFFYTIFETIDLSCRLSANTLHWADKGILNGAAKVKLHTQLSDPIQEFCHAISGKFNHFSGYVDR